MGLAALDLGPQTPLPHPAQLYFASACLRASYFNDVAWCFKALAAAGSTPLYRSTIGDNSYPLWFGADFGTWQLIAVAGTANVAQWQGNLFSVGQVALAPYPGKVHAYFGVVAGGIAANVQQVMGGASQLNNVLLLGHSLGGAVAMLLAHNLNAVRPGSVKLVITEGAPRVGNAAWALAQPWKVLRLQNSGDVVPSVPPRQGWVVNQIADLTAWGPCQDYFPCGYGCNIGPGVLVSDGEETTWTQAYAGLVFGALNQGLSANALPHSAGNYAWAVRQWMGPAVLVQQDLGLDLILVDAFQKGFGVLDGYHWPLP